MMDRRTFLAGTGAVLLAAPLTAEAQPAGKVYRVGWLDMRSPSVARPEIEVFTQAMRDLGWADGKNIAFEFRFAENKTERLPELTISTASKSISSLRWELPGFKQLSRRQRRPRSSCILWETLSRVVWSAVWLDPEGTSRGHPGLV